MKIYLKILIIFINLVIGCSRKNYSDRTKTDSEIVSINLDANHSNDINAKVNTILKQKNEGNVSLDGKNYKLNQFKSIIDTLSSGYQLMRISSDSIKIIRNNPKLKK